MYAPLHMLCLFVQEYDSICVVAIGATFFGVTASVVALFVFKESFMRKVDNLGRIVIPKELRTKYGLVEEAEITFEDSGDGILVKPSVGLCRLCGEFLGEVNSEFLLCKRCIEKVKKL